MASKWQTPNSDLLHYSAQLAVRDPCIVTLLASKFTLLWGNIKETNAIKAFKYLRTTWNKWLSLRRLHELQVRTHATPGDSQRWIKDTKRLLRNENVLHKYALHKSNAELNRKLSLPEIWIVSENRKKNVRFTPEQATKVHRGSTLSLTSALDGVGGQRHAPAALTPEKSRYPLYRWLVGPQGRSGRVRKISRQPGFDPRTAQPVASRYTDCAIPAHTKVNVHIITGNYLVRKRKKIQTFKKEGFTNDSKNPGARRVTSSKFHTEDPQLLGTTI